ncbi:MAG TPA: type IV pilus assembly protein PilM [Patescibacteria group bacterium]|jgi:type IV pilus assembly protein PilM|nr:type IV pilus assembly protein PilM [Patescibacteria group bacterium]
MIFGQKNSMLGVDIGSSSIKIVQIDRGDKPRLVTYGMVDIAEPITSQTTDEQVHALADLLKNLLEKAHATTKNCVMSLPNSAVFTSVIDMPKMDDKEMESAMQFEAKKYVPLPFSEVTLSWTIISDNDDGTSSKVLLIAVPNQIRDIYIKLFQLAGLNLEIIEIEALSLIRAIVVDKTKNDVIIDIGAKVTGLNFVRQGSLQLTRNLSIGGDTITERIAQALNLSAPRAEQFKTDFGLQGTDFLPEAVKPVLSIIKTEVAQIIGIYNSHDVATDRIVLVGGGAQLPGITEYFQSELGVPTILGNSLAQVTYDESAAAILSRYAVSLTIAIGLAIREEA